MNEDKNISITPFTHKNKYSKLISIALKKTGAKVKMINPNFLKPFRAFEDKDTSLIIMYWPQVFFSNTKNPILNFIKKKIFYFQKKKLKNKKLIFSIENYSVHDSKYQKSDHNFTQQILNEANGLIASTSYALKKFTLRFKIPSSVKKTIIPHTNYNLIYKKKISKKKAKKIMNFDLNKKICFAPCNIRPYKGIESLISIFFKLNLKNTILIIAGNGNKNYIKKIKKLIEIKSKNKISELIFIPEYISDKKISIFLSACDFLAIDYRKEPANPGTPILAMTFGKPIFGNGNGVLPHLINQKYMFFYKKKKDKLRILKKAFKSNCEKHSKLILRHSKQYHDINVVSKKFGFFIKKFL